MSDRTRREMDCAVAALVRSKREEAVVRLGRSSGAVTPSEQDMFQGESIKVDEASMQRKEEEAERGEEAAAEEAMVENSVAQEAVAEDSVAQEAADIYHHVISPAIKCRRHCGEGAGGL